MADPSTSASRPSVPARPWRRVRRRAWTRQPVDGSHVSLMALIPYLSRPQLSQFVTAAIDRLDQIDGDPDLEDLREDWEDGHDREECAE